MQQLWYSAVIFDMDGVIVDSEPLHIELEGQLFRELGVAVSKEEAASFLGRSSRDIWHIMRKNHALTMSVEELIDLERTRYRALVEARGVPYVPGVVDLIRDLAARDVPLALASSASREQITHALETADITQCFRIQACGDEVDKSKPDPAVFLLAARRLGIAPEECLVIEDSPNGVAAARAAGMRCIGFSNPGSGSPDLSDADVVCSTMQEVRQALLMNECPSDEGPPEECTSDEGPSAAS